MASGKILSHKGGGLYSVEVYYDSGSIVTRLAELTENILKTNKAIVDMWADLQAAEAAKDSYIAATNVQINYIATLEQGTEAFKEAHKALIVLLDEGLTARNEYLLIKYDYELLQSEHTTLSIEHTKLDNTIIENPIMDIWCIDLADGIGLREIYADNTEITLWCLNYDLGEENDVKYLIPPKMSDIILFPDSKVNIPLAYTEMEQACMTFWNAAMEPGFARWQPILLQGTLRGPPVSQYNCTSVDIPFEANTVSFPFSRLSRFGGDLLSGSYNIAGITYMNQDDSFSFDDGDQVVCNVVINELTAPTNSQAATYDVMVYVLGFVSNPKYKDSAISTGLEALHILFNTGLPDGYIGTHWTDLLTITGDATPGWIYHPDPDNRGILGTRTYTLAARSESGTNTITSNGRPYSWSYSASEVVVKVVYGLLSGAEDAHPISGSISEQKISRTVTVDGFPSITKNSVANACTRSYYASSNRHSGHNDGVSNIIPNGEGKYKYSRYTKSADGTTGQVGNILSRVLPVEYRQTVIESGAGCSSEAMYEREPIPSDPSIGVVQYVTLSLISCPAEREPSFSDVGPQEPTVLAIDAPFPPPYP